MSIEVACLAAGILPGYLSRKKPAVVSYAGLLTTVSIHILLFFLGASLGADSVLFPKLVSLGGNAIILGLCCALGGAVALRLGGRFFMPGRSENDGMKKTEGRAQEQASGNHGSLLKTLAGSLRILACFALGLTLGRLDWLPGFAADPNAALWMLRLMMLGVGMSLGFDLKAFGVVRELGPKVLLVPLLVTMGTFAGALAAALMLPELKSGEAICAGAGFGYYSLSSLILTQIGNPALGSVALLSNIARELFSLVATPLLARFLGPLAPTGAAGATSMDTCLPVIVRFCGERNGIIAVFNGICLTLAPPFLIPLLYNFLMR